MINIERNPKMKISFCKSIADRELALQLLKLLIKSFPMRDWNFVIEEGDCEISPEDPDFLEEHAHIGKKAPVLRQVSVDEYVEKFWGEYSGCYIWTKDLKNGFSIRLPGKKPSRLTWLYSNMTFQEGNLNLDLQYKEQELILQCSKRFLIDSCSILEPSFGTIRDLNQKESRPISSSIPGIFWVTLLGPDYVQIIGREKFTDLPCFSLEWLPDGTALIQLTSTFEESLTPEALLLSKHIKEKLGMHLFKPKTDPMWYPKLRNLVVDEKSFPTL